MIGTNIAPAATAAASDVAGDGPGAAVPAPGGPRPAGAAGAVWDALMGAPGASTTALANAAGVSRATALKALVAMADAGYAIRTVGGRTPGGKPMADTWTPITRQDVPDANDAGTSNEHSGEENNGDEDTSEEDTSEENSSAREAEDTKARDVDPHETPVVLGGSVRTIQDAFRILEQEETRRADTEAELARAEAEEQARRVRAAAELALARSVEGTRQALADLLTAVTTAYAAVVAGDEEGTAAGIEAVTAEAAKVRKVAAGGAGRAAGSVRVATRAGGVAVGGSVRSAPRPLRPLVAEHLAAHPGKEFTPGEIARVLGRSSGAVANALSTMCGAGEAELTCDRPTRYRAIATGPDAV